MRWRPDAFEDRVCDLLHIRADLGRNTRAQNEQHPGRFLGVEQHIGTLGTLIGFGHLQYGFAVRFGVAALERAGPTAVRLDHRVDFGHQPDRLRQGDNDLVVVLDVLLAQHPSLAVFEPLFADLVSANVEVPNGLRHALEATCSRPGFGLLASGIKPHGVVDPADFEHFPRIADEGGHRLVEPR